MCEFVLCAALSGRKLTPAKVQNTTRFYSVTALRTVSFLFTFTVVYAWHFHTSPFVVCKLHYTFALYVSELLYCLPTPTPTFRNLNKSSVVRIDCIFPKFLQKSTHHFLSYPTSSETDRQTAVKTVSPLTSGGERKHDFFKTQVYINLHVGTAPLKLSDMPKYALFTMR